MKMKNFENFGNRQFDLLDGLDFFLFVCLFVCLLAFFEGYRYIYIPLDRGTLFFSGSTN